ncbi:MAG TPA: LamG domain-containing protein [Kofleriaceae bacterium]|nr:LamG domain-containing protein [Kofleriaceae bacterium]
MRHVVLVLVVALAGCDGVFNLDKLHLPPDSAVDAPPLDASLDDGLVLHLSFDGNLTDSVSGVPAACVGGANTCPKLAAGNLGSAAAFDGADDCLTANLSVVGTVITVALWFNVPTDTSVSLIAKPYTGALDSWQIDTDSNRTLRFISFDTNGATGVVLPTAFTVNTWVHVAITYDGASVRNLYVNGSLRANDGPSQFAIDTGPVYIGCDRDGGAPARHMAGSLDDVRVYRRVLTADEIKALANL